MRLDLFLKTSRLVKRRIVAKELCEEGRVLVNGRDAGPAKDLRQGDVITIKYASKRIEVEVLAVPERPGKALSEDLYRVTAESRTGGADDE